VIPRPEGPPISSVNAVFQAGGAVGPPAAWWADDFMARSDMPRVLELLNGTATQYASANDYGSHRAWAMGPSGNFDAQLYAVRNLLGPITYYGRGSSIRQWRGDARKELAKQPSAFVGRVMDHHLYPGHPYADVWWELDDAAAALTRGKVRSWRRTVVRPERGTVVVSGRVDPDAAAAAVGTWLDDWRVRPARASERGAAVPDALPRAITGLAWDYPLVSAYVACRIAPRSAETDAAADVLEALLDRGMDQTLRDRGGAYAYWARVGTLDGRVATVSLRAQVGAQSGRATVDALFDLLGLVGEGPSEAVLEWGKRAALNRRAERLASAAAAEDLAIEALEAGMTFEELAGWPERLAAVDAAALKRLLEPCLGREVAVVVGPRDLALGSDAAWVNWEAQAAAVR
jgi:predicted Zn-dependent peptidase